MPELEEVYFEETHILFLTCTVVHTDDLEVSIADKILTKGKLKAAHMDATTPRSGDCF